MMLVVVSYDISTRLPEGRRRLRQAAKICEDFGQRVQCSVFECWVDASQMVGLKSELLKTVDLRSDSLRFYFMGERLHGRVEHHGIKTVPNPDGPLVL